jgi:hypothetical protein
MTGADEIEDAELEVLDAFEHPHGGRILRVRFAGGRRLSLKDLRGARIAAVSPEGTVGRARIVSFPLTGGRPSEKRFRDTGRLDLLVAEEDGPPISLGWRLRLRDR